jgi:hypothetical protein
MACPRKLDGHYIAMKRRRLNLFGPEYQPPGDDIVKLAKDCWAIPFWGATWSGPTGVLFLPDQIKESLAGSSESRLIVEVDVIMFHEYARRTDKRHWLDTLGLSAIREDVNRTKVPMTDVWVPLLREFKKPFGLIRRYDAGKVEEFCEIGHGEAHVFGDGFTLAQRREYAKKLGADIGLVEPLKGKPK